MNFKSIGNNVKISKKASFYGADKIEIGDNVRIDDFCVLSAGEGGIKIGSNIHIGIQTSLIGKGKIELCDFVNISSKVSIYSSNDDYSGEYMTSPIIDEKFTNVYHASVKIGKHTVIGSNSVILPGVNIGECCSIGALSFIKQNTNLKNYGIYAGIPIKFIKKRKNNLELLENKFKNK